MESLESEFDHEDDETINNALRMAAESAMAHTSSGGRSRTRGSAAAGAEVLDADGGGDASTSASVSPVVIGARSSGGMRSPHSQITFPPDEDDEFWDDFPMLEDEIDAVTAESQGGMNGSSSAGEQEGIDMSVVGGGGVEAGREERELERGERREETLMGGGDWETLTTSGLKRKTVAELKGFLEQRGVQPPGRARKAELVEQVSELLQAA